MKRFAWVLLLMSTSPVYAVNDGDRSSIGDRKPLSHAEEEEAQQPSAFEQPAAEPDALPDDEAERPRQPDSAPIGH